MSSRYADCYNEGINYFRTQLIAMMYFNLATGYDHFQASSVKSCSGVFTVHLYILYNWPEDGHIGSKHVAGVRYTMYCSSVGGNSIINCSSRPGCTSAPH